MENHNRPSWLGKDERLVVAEMIRDRHSEYWEECAQFVRRSVYAKAKNIPTDLQDDINQDIMYKVAKFLPHFRFECTFKSWLNLIADRCVIDAYRKLQSEARSQLQLAVVDPPNESDGENEELNTREVISAEEAFETNDKIQNGLKALLEYANTHANPTRNLSIIRWVLFEGKTYEEAAIAAGASSAVVGYVVRQAQHYAREAEEHS